MTVSAQQQPNNPGFENWDNVGNDTEEPVSFNSMMTGDLCTFCQAGASQRVFRDGSDYHGGSYSVRIESTSAVGITVNGTLTTGRVIAPSTTASEGYTQTLRNNADFNHAFTDEPDSLVFWAKYNLTDNSDSASVAAILHDDFDMRDPGGDNAHVIATARKVFQTAGVWERISVPFQNTGTSSSPVAYLLMTFTSSFTPGQGNSNATLWVDDAEFIYNSPVTAVDEQLAEVVKVYPNPTNDGRVSISLGNEMKNGMVTVLNVMGQTVGQFSFVNDNRIDVEVDQPTGIYFLNIRTEEGQSTTVRVVRN